MPGKSKVSITKTYSTIIDDGADAHILPSFSGPASTAAIDPIPDSPVKSSVHKSVEVGVSKGFVSKGEVDKSVLLQSDFIGGSKSVGSDSNSFKKDISSSITTVEQKWRLLPEFLYARGLVKQHISSYNYFLNIEMQEILKANSEIRADCDPSFFIRYTNIYVGKPDYEEFFTQTEVTPFQCRTRQLTYSAKIYVDIQYTKARKIETQKGVVIGRIPIMLRSCKCALEGKNELEMAKLQECPYDPGGYFIVKGGEKVILIQEQLANNRLILEEDDLGCAMGTVTSSTHERKSRNQILIKKDRMYLRHNTLTGDIPIVAVLKALGVQSDQEIVAMVGSEDEIANYLVLSLAETRSLGILTQRQALHYIGGLVRPPKIRKRIRSRIDEARDIMRDVVFPHIPVENFNFWNKAIYVAHVTRQVILASKDKRLLSDKDYYGNKRLELAGALLSLLFEDLFKRFNQRVKMNAEKVLSKLNRAQEFDAALSLPQQSEVITGGFITALSTGNWSLKRFRMEKKGVTETLSRLSFIAALGHVTRIRSHVEKSRKISGPRALQPSQWGMVCPSDTPEGEQCGLVKSLAILAHITSDEDAEGTIRLLYDLGVEDITMLAAEELYTPPAFMVEINGRIIGVHRFPDKLNKDFKTLRRRGLIGEFASICVNHIARSVHIATLGGRICRPLIIVNQDTHLPQISVKLLDELKAGVRDFQSFLDEGAIEYLDANEENSCFIALNDASITPQTTHLEIDCVTIMGVVSALIPYPHHNQSPRNTYQCAMGKQAIGFIAHNQQLRVDLAPLNIMVYPMAPMCRSKILDMANFDMLPAGQNAIVAVMSFSGYDIEDAVVLNRFSLDRGYGRIVSHHKYSTSVRSHPNGQQDRVSKKPEFSEAWPDRQAYDIQTEKYRALGGDGIVEVNEKVYSGNILVNRETPANTTDYGGSTMYTPSCTTYKEPKDHGFSVVDKVVLTAGIQDKFIIRIQTRDMRRPELGDKFSSRHGQKGVVGIIVPQTDMPFNEKGVCPDMIMNPHGFPSRMTVGKMIELLAGKAGLMDGKRRFGTCFGGDKVADCSATLIKAGYAYSGKDMLYSGITGEVMHAYIFMGPVYYQRLKHMVKDKMFARGRGPHLVLTRQPTQGRQRDGGLRVGEMERDCLVAHGTALLLVERLLLSSDPFVASVCKLCGLLARSGWCQHCRRGDAVSDLRMPYACKLLFQELQAMNIRPKIKLEKGGFFDKNSISAIFGDT